MAKKESLKSILSDMKKANSQAKKTLASIDKKIAKIDQKYVGAMVKDNFNILKLAKNIILKKV